MATSKTRNKKKVESNSDLLWRKPITLDDDEPDDPLASMYQGREVNTQNAVTPPIQKAEKIISESAKENPKSSVKPKPTIERKKTIKVKDEPAEQPSDTKIGLTPKISESDLKKILKIKSENFQFTDIREILRGKSLDMYAYLRHLAGETGVCKIKHLDLMKRLDISRPTLFKQGDWLTTLSLIEKRNVPGDHFGTSYIIHRFEEILPVSETLKQQLELHLKNLVAVEISD